MKNCRSIEKKITAYLHGELGDREVHALEIHLESCKACRAALETQRATLDLLDATLEAAPAPEQLSPWKKPVIRRRNLLEKIWFSVQLKAVLSTATIFSLLFLFSGMLVVFTVVNKEEKRFEPPPLVERPNMKLKKLQVPVNASKGEPKPKPKLGKRVVAQDVLFEDASDMPMPEAAGASRGRDYVADTGTSSYGIQSEPAAGAAFSAPTRIERPKMKLKKPKVKVQKRAVPKTTTRIVTRSRSAGMPNVQLPEMSGMSAGLSSAVAGYEMVPESHVAGNNVNVEPAPVLADESEVSLESLMTTPKPLFAGTPSSIKRKSTPLPTAEPQLTESFYLSSGEAVPEPEPALATVADDYGFMDQKSERCGETSKGIPLAEKSDGAQPESDYQLLFGAAEEDMPILGSALKESDALQRVDGLEPAKPDGAVDLFGGVDEVSLGMDDDTKLLGDEMSLAEGLDEAKDEGDRSEWLMREAKPAVFNPYFLTVENAFSTFSIDVDTASYGLARQRLLAGGLPEPEQVRTEEFINSFDYDYRPPSGKQTFAVHTEMAPSPFRLGMDTLKIGIKGRRIGRDDHRGAVLTLVVDTSGSMSTPERLGLVKASLALMIDQLSPQDRVAIVQFGSEARLVLEHTPASEKAALLNAINALQPGGPTQFDRGLALGYRLAEAGFRAGESNRIMILSDGVANLGELDPEAILKQVAEQRKQGIYLSVLGFGAGTYDDDMLERLANKGDGMYAYIDTLDEARHLLVDQLAATLHVIASDVKIQVEFNPERVVCYRQLGYENRQLTKEQFRDDTVDAGEVGSGQSVTALYDVELKPDGPADEPIATVYVRYRRADNGAIEEISSRVTDVVRARRFEDADTRFQLSVCTAEFAERLRRSPYTEGTEIGDIAGRLQPVALELSLDGQVQELGGLISIAESLER